MELYAWDEENSRNHCIQVGHNSATRTALNRAFIITWFWGKSWRNHESFCRQSYRDAGEKHGKPSNNAYLSSFSLLFRIPTTSLWFHNLTGTRERENAWYSNQHLLGRGRAALDGVNRDSATVFALIWAITTMGYNRSQNTSISTSRKRRSLMARLERGTEAYCSVSTDDCDQWWRWPDSSTPHDCSCSETNKCYIKL